MKIGVIGTGYVGLVSGTCFAEMGNDVICVDIDQRKVEKLSRGELTIFEPGIERLLERNLREERLRFTTDLAEAVEASEILFLALPTPPGEDGSADLSYVLGVAGGVADLLAANPGWGYRILVDKSTVPVGTAARVTAIVEERGLKAGVHFDVVSNPEFLREGVAVDDFMKPERVVIGTESEQAAELMTQLYEPFVRSGNPILVMDEKSAEMTKYAANALLATKITFMNEIANVCERVGANVDKVRHGIGTDSRIGSKFLYAGIGFGGSCFPKDVQALVRTAQENDYAFEILESVLRVNERQRGLLAERVIEHFGGDLTGKRIAVWGLAFKPNTDDVREAPAHTIIRALTERGAAFIIAARYVPIGRVAVNMTAGAVHYPRIRFTLIAAIAAVLWGGYSTLLGMGAGLFLHDHPLVGIAVGMTGGVLLGFAVDALLKRMDGRFAKLLGRGLEEFAASTVPTAPSAASPGDVARADDVDAGHARDSS